MTRVKIATIRAMTPGQPDRTGASTGVSRTRTGAVLVMVLLGLTCPGPARAGRVGRRDVVPGGRWRAVQARRRVLPGPTFRERQRRARPIASWSAVGFRAGSPRPPGVSRPAGCVRPAFGAANARSRFVVMVCLEVLGRGAAAAREPHAPSSWSRRRRPRHRTSSSSRWRRRGCTGRSRPGNGSTTSSGCGAGMPGMTASNSGPRTFGIVSPCLRPVPASSQLDASSTTRSPAPGKQAYDSPSEAALRVGAGVRRPVGRRLRGWVRLSGSSAAVLVVHLEAVAPEVGRLRAGSGGRPRWRPGTRGWSPRHGPASGWRASSTE